MGKTYRERRNRWSDDSYNIDKKQKMSKRKRTRKDFDSMDDDPWDNERKR